VFVLTFQGDIRATAVKRLAAEVSAVLGVARKGVDEVVVRVESPGGSVTGYGLAASQLLRLRDSGVALTACVDQVAASGGYLMACAADKIISAPFAITGSIGVVAQVPNVHRLLQKNSIDFDHARRARAFPGKARRDARGVQGFRARTSAKTRHGEGRQWRLLARRGSA
jgi:serine protease SohB